MTVFRFEIRDKALCKVDVATGRPISRRDAMGTKIVQMLRKDERVVIREDCYEFPTGRSNVYCLDHDLALIWVAELPMATDVYANPVIDKGETLECASWQGYTCQLDPESGKIVGSLFTR
jgi:hypothetical protein